MTVLRVERNTGQIQHIHDVRIAHFVANGEGDHIEILHGVLALQSPQGKSVLSHSLFHICPGGEHPLAPYAVHLVHDAVEDPHTHIGHTDLIGIREAESHPHPDLGFIFLYFVVFAAGIPGRLLHCRQNALK